MKKFIDESWLVLVLGVVFALLLAGTQSSLQAKIKENQERALNEAIAKVVPGTTTTEKLEIDGNDVYKCLNEPGELTGWAVDAGGVGFIDKIQLVVGLPPKCNKILGIEVINDNETPGLGNKIRSSQSQWSNQYVGMDASVEIKVLKSGANKDNNEIDAITGATWSSKYVTDIVNDVMTRIRPKLLERK